MRKLGPPPTQVQDISSETWRNWFAQIESRLNWNDVTFTNSWANVGGSYYNAQYTKDAWGRISLRGRINTGTSGNACFTLPEHFRPNALVEFICAGEAGGSPAVAYVTIDSSGVVTPTISGASIEVSLDGLTFIAEK